MSNTSDTAFDTWWESIRLPLDSGLSSEQREQRDRRSARLAWDAALHWSSYPILNDILDNP